MRAGQSHLPCSRCARVRVALVAWLVALASPALARAQDALQVAGPDAPPVAARSIPRGAELVADDIAPGSDSVMARLGWIARRVIRAGEVLREPAVEPPPLIRAGQPVQYQVTVNGISVSMTGTALSDASLGQEVVVRLDPKRRLSGIVTGRGVVVQQRKRDS